MPAIWVPILGLVLTTSALIYIFRDEFFNEE